MTLNISLSPETEVKLREIALAEGKDIAQFVSQLVEQEVRNSNGLSSHTSVDRQLTALKRFIDRVRQAGGSYPAGYAADDSRESIYEGRGE